MRLRTMAEPLVVNTAEEANIEVDCYATRQMRRRAQRAEAKAARRSGSPGSVVVAEARKEAAEPVNVPDELLAEIHTETPTEPPSEMPVHEAAAAMAEALARTRGETSVEAPYPAPAEMAVASPLPGSRALVKRPSGFLARLFGGLIPRKPAKLERRDPDALTEQMLVLRTELALVQMRLDRMIAASSA